MAGVMAIVMPLGVEMGSRQLRPSHTSRTETTSINMIIKDISCLYLNINFCRKWVYIFYNTIFIDFYSGESIIIGYTMY